MASLIDSPVFVSSDCALGSRRGDVDDGFAVAALLTCAVPLTLASSHGNTSELEARRNLSRLRDLAGRDDVAVLAGAGVAASFSAAGRWLAARQESTSIVALGPLTDLAAALDLDPSCARRWSQVILVGGNRRSHGRWPPPWPYEFNLTKDRAATAVALREIQSLVVVPLDRARRLRAEGAELERLAGSTLGDDLRAGSRRWVRRNRWLKGRSGFPVWDLVAVATLCWPHLVRLEAGPLSSGLPLAAYGLAEREALWVADFDAAGIFEALVGGLSALSGLDGR